MDQSTFALGRILCAKRLRKRGVRALPVKNCTPSEGGTSVAGGQWRAVPGRKAGPGVGRWDEYGELELVAGDGWLDGEWMAERTMWLNICGCGGDYGKIRKICGCDDAGGMLRGQCSGAWAGAGVGC